MTEIERAVVADTLGRADWFLAQAQREIAKCSVAIVVCGLTNAAFDTLEKLEAVRREVAMLQQEFERIAA